MNFPSIQNLLSTIALTFILILTYALSCVSEFLLRKEVIQPQVPLRLPCYDLVPITSLALGRCLSCELAHELRAKPAFMT